MIIETLRSKEDELPLELAIIEPVGPPVGMIQLFHGMAEHKERYYEFMDYLALHGFICAIHDHRGHGSSVHDFSHLGYFYTEDISALVEDAYQVTDYLVTRYPGLNLTIFSHSMGTLVARSYLKKYDDKIDQIIMSGPPTKNNIVKPALALAKFLKPFYGKYNPNRLLNRLALEPYNKGYEEKNSWISSDSQEVTKYNADPQSGFIFTTNGFINLFKLLKAAQQTNDWHPKHKDLPILLMAGEEDPVIQSVDKLNELAQSLEIVGYHNISIKLYENKRHELLNEKDNHIIFEDVLTFLKSTRPVSNE